MKHQNPQYFVAIDMGSSNGRIVLGVYDHEELELHEAHRFTHEVQRCDNLYCWDWPWIEQNIISGLQNAAQMTGGKRIISVSCDSWAQDFGMLDREGKVIASPLAYRNAEFAEALKNIEQIFTPEELVRQNGAVHSPITSLCQLTYLYANQLQKMRQVAKILPIADLVHNFLGGVVSGDPTLLGASQLLRLQDGEVDLKLLNILGIPIEIIPERCKDFVGVVTHRALPEEFSGTKIVAGVGHDTAAAFFAARSGKDELFISLGSWAMTGCVVDELPANSGADLAILPLADGQIGIFHPGNGMWLMQQCVKTWEKNGIKINNAELDNAACQSEYELFFDPDREDLALYGNKMPEMIAQLIGESCVTPGDTLRIINRSLLEKIRQCKEDFSVLTGTAFSGAVMVSGGVRNVDLVAAFEKRVRLPLRKGSPESSAVGNILYQMRLQQININNVTIREQL